MKYGQKKFSVAMGGDAYSANYDRAFGKRIPAEEQADAEMALADYKDDAESRLLKFVDVMGRKFLARTGDAFYGVEVGGPDEAECRVSDIAKVLTDLHELRRENENLRATLDAALAGRGK